VRRSAVMEPTVGLLPAAWLANDLVIRRRSAVVVMLATNAAAAPPPTGSHTMKPFCFHSSSSLARTNNAHSYNSLDESTTRESQKLHSRYVSDQSNTFMTKHHLRA
jgi:hypothetical protein